MLDENQLEVDGFVVGDGTDYTLRNLRARGLPSTRRVRQPRPLKHGVRFGGGFFEGRLITGLLSAEGTNPENTHELRDDLAAKLTTRDPVLVRFREKGSPETLRTEGVAELFAPELDLGAVGFDAELEIETEDPILYSDTEESGSTPLGSVTGGLQPPHAVPHGFATATSGDIPVTNDGNASVLPTFCRITAGAGGASNLTILHVEKDERIKFADSLAEGDFLDFVFDDERVLLGGTADRFGSLTDDMFFTLDPGAQTVQLGGEGTATLDLRWRHGHAI